MSAGPVPNPLIVAHVQMVGRWCPGVRRGEHWAESLVVSAGRVLCPECGEDRAAELARREPA